MRSQISNSVLNLESETANSSAHLVSAETKRKELAGPGRSGFGSGCWPSGFQPAGFQPAGFQPGSPGAALVPALAPAKPDAPARKPVPSSTSTAAFLPTAFHVHDEAPRSDNQIERRQSVAAPQRESRWPGPGHTRARARVGRGRANRDRDESSSFVGSKRFFSWELRKVLVSKFDKA